MCSQRILKINCESPACPTISTLLEGEGMTIKHTCENMQVVQICKHFVASLLSSCQS